MAHDQDSCATVICLAIKPRANALEAFYDWQMQFNAQVVSCRGFVSIEFLAPNATESQWHIVQHFSSRAHAAMWQQSAAWQDLMQKLKALATENVFYEETVWPQSATEVFIAHVAAGQEKDFHLWTAKMHRQESHFPGFCALHVQSPPPNCLEGRWIAVLQFDSPANLERWLQSAERAELLQQSAGFISALQSNCLLSPYSVWFTSAKGCQLAAWKSAMVVLLVLFPIVMLEIRFIAPVFGQVHASFATFILNALSVALLTFPCMPMANRALSWWLLTSAKGKTLFGAVLLTALYAVEVILFWII